MSTGSTALAGSALATQLTASASASRPIRETSFRDLMHFHPPALLWRSRPARRIGCLGILPRGTDIRVPVTRRRAGHTGASGRDKCRGQRR